MIPVGAARTLERADMIGLAPIATWWSAQRTGPGMPPMSAFDPTVLPEPLVTQIGAVSGFDAQGRMRKVFAGSKVAIFGGADKAEYLDEIYPPELYPLVQAVFRTIEHHCAPMGGAFHLGLDGVALLTTRRIYLPMLDGQGGVGLFLCGMVYEPTAEGIARRTRVTQPGLTVTGAELFWLDLG